MTDYVPPIYPDVQTLDRDRQIGRSNWQQQWLGSYIVTEVVKAADYHRARLSWWEDEQAKAKEAIGADGLSVREQQVTGGVQHTVVIDPTLSARLNECESKIQLHRQKAELLDAWVLFLNAALTQTFTLTFADIEFFEIGRHD